MGRKSCRRYKEAQRAITTNNFDALGRVMELPTLKMHATALTAQPGLWYWNATWEALECIKSLRTEALPFYFTMDADPVKYSFAGIRWKK